MEVTFKICLYLFTRIILIQSTILTVLALPKNWEILQNSISTNWNLSQIDAGISSYIWAMDDEGKAHVKHGLNDEWLDLNDLQGFSLSWVSTGLAGVWGIKKEYGIPVFRAGITESEPLGTEWVEIEGRGFRIIDSGLSGNVYGLTQQGKLYYRDGVTISNPKGASWKEIWGAYRFVSAGTYGVWVIDFYGRIYFGKGRSENLAKFRNWQRVDNIPGVDIESVVTGFDGSVWALSKNGEVFQRKSVNILNPAGSPFWSKINDLKLAKITAGLPGVIGITDNNEILAFRGKSDIFCLSVLIFENTCFFIIPRVL